MGQLRGDCGCGGRDRGGAPVAALAVGRHGDGGLLQEHTQYNMETIKWTCGKNNWSQLFIGGN